MAKAAAVALSHPAQAATLSIMIEIRRIVEWAGAIGLAATALLAGCSATSLNPEAESNRSGAMQDVDRMLAEVSPQAVKEIVETLVTFGTRHTLSDTESDTRGIGAARRWIHREFEKIALLSERTDGEAMKVYFDSHAYGPDRRRVPVETEIVNVVAELPGSMLSARSRRYYVIGHYDSRAGEALDTTTDAPGANDDASGVAVVMELARVMSKRRYDATIVFMATAGEEQGLLGARLHATVARERGEDIRAVLSNDIVGDPKSPSGRVFDKHIRVFSEALPRTLAAEDLARIRSLGMENDSPSRQIARYVAETARKHGLAVQPMLINRTDRFLRGGDHTSFNEAGYPAVRFTIVEENYDRQHQDVRLVDGVQFGDLPEYVDAQYLAGVTRVNGAALAHLANAPSTPGNARIVTAALGNDTLLRWNASPEADVAGYEVVWRATIEHEWTDVHDAGLETEVTLPFSKDNHFFGVRAYDRDGYRSPVSFCGAAGR